MLGCFSSPVDIISIDIGKLTYLINELFNSVIRINFYELLCFYSTLPSFTGVLLESQYWVPRIRLLFCAEDPRVFAQRVQFAENLRQNTEASNLYHHSVDCMPVWHLHPTSLERIRKYALSTSGLQLKW